jgi:hypothetical protein
MCCDFGNSEDDPARPWISTASRQVFTKANVGGDSTATHMAIHPPTVSALRGSAEPVLDYLVKIAETHHRDRGIRA